MTTDRLGRVADDLLCRGRGTSTRVPQYNRISVLTIERNLNVIAKCNRICRASCVEITSRSDAMNSFVRGTNDPANPARFQHLAERMFGICEQRGWKHDPMPESQRPFTFWPWGSDMASVHASPAILRTGAGKLEEHVGLIWTGCPLARTGSTRG